MTNNNRSKSNRAQDSREQQQSSRTEDAVKHGQKPEAPGYDKKLDGPDRPSV